MKSIKVYLLAILAIVVALKMWQGCRAQRYLVNCKKIEPGMTVKQAEKMMGDDDGSDHTTTRGELQYITPAFARTGTTVYFNPETEVVTEVICGDQKWSGL